ncbi:MAG: adenylyltransferase/cytidyltransferase family protein [Nanoarchaeota archaeon]|nr:adenylyltransferase/cytidyltransferase family protein [Nanoarchaeota archaeon]
MPKEDWNSSGKNPSKGQIDYSMREPFMRKLKTVGQMSEIREKIKKEGKTLVWTNGCFDLGHWGHVRYFSCGKAYGDYLIVAINSDDSVRRLKGPHRPIMDWMARIEAISHIESVDFILIFESDSPLRELEILKPDVCLKGNDYTLETVNQMERKLIESYGGRIEITPTSVDSTTKVLERITDYLKTLYDPQTGEFDLKKGGYV